MEKIRIGCWEKRGLSRPDIHGIGFKADNHAATGAEIRGVGEFVIIAELTTPGETIGSIADEGGRVSCDDPRCSWAGCTVVREIMIRVKGIPRRGADIIARP